MKVHVISRLSVTTVALLWTVAPPLQAQTAVVKGVVVDSLTGSRRDRTQPLASAIVTLVEIGLTASTDREGRFALTPVPAGTYTVSFFHPSLDSLDVSAPRWQVVVPSTGEVVLRLATPSIGTVYRRLCRSAWNPAHGFVFGRVFGADSSQLQPGATVSTQWSEVRFRSPVRPEHLRREFVSDERGLYHLCDLPTDIVADLAVTFGGRSAGPVPVEFGTRGFMRQDLMLGLEGDSSATITGVVRDSRGRPTAAVLVGVAGMSRPTRSATDGHYLLREVPSGSRVVEARKIGMRPGNATTMALPHRTVNLDIVLGAATQELAAAVIVGVPRTDRDGFLRRKRGGLGQQMSGDEFRLHGYLRLSDALSSLGLSQEYDPASSTPLFTMRGIIGGKCTPRVYLDGSVWPSWGNPFESLDSMFWPRDVGGIEVYRALQEPVNFPPDPLSQCGVILIWRR